MAAETLPHDLVVVDNASTDGTAQLLADDFHTRQSSRSRATPVSPAAWDCRNNGV